MTVYYVTTRDFEPLVSERQKELILKLPLDETIKNRFPFDDIDLNKSEVYATGSEIECQQYIDAMPPQIKDLFKIGQYGQQVT